MLFDEKTMTFEKAARSLPVPVDPSTIWRWARVGLRGVRLEYLAQGRRLVTSAQALERFSRALSEAQVRTSGPAVLRAPGKPVPRMRSEGDRAPRLRAAEDFLAGLGM